MVRIATTQVQMVITKPTDTTMRASTPFSPGNEVLVGRGDGVGNGDGLGSSVERRA